MPVVVAGRKFLRLALRPSGRPDRPKRTIKFVPEFRQAVNLIFKAFIHLRTPLLRNPSNMGNSKSVAE